MPTPEEAYNFCMQVWESDTEAEKKTAKEKPAKEKPAADAETQAEEATTSAADAAQRDEYVDDSAEV